MNEFLERLKELLDENKLNRLTLSKKLNISSTTIDGYFNRHYYPEINIAIKMAKFFNCSLDYLFGLSDTRNSDYEIEIDEISTTLIHNLDILIKENRLSIASVMRELNMSEYNYYRWKNGRFPKTVNLISLAKYFDISIDKLIGKRK